MANNKFDKIMEMATSKQRQKEFNNEMVDKTWKYQKKFGFETSQRKGHEFWNNEADAFKHAFGSAKMSLDMGTLGSMVGGIYHESQTPNNPLGEWNMDSWNNNQGRKIVKDIYKEYGNKFDTFSQDRKDAIIAAKVMMKMKNGELIIRPSDKRQYKGILENMFKGKLTGYASSVDNIFTPDQIGSMSSSEFTQKEPAIMNQLQQGLIGNPESDLVSKYSGYSNPLTGGNRIYSAEEIGNLSGSEFTKLEPEINAQWGSIGIPSKNELSRASGGGGTVYVEGYTRSDGTEVQGYYRSR